jgi:hypothetical protein
MTSIRPTLYPIPLVGWREDVRLPELGGELVIAKIDTGARTAALHAADITIKGKRVSFVLELEGRKHKLEMPVVGVKRIKSSSGHSEVRPMIETTLEIGHHKFNAEVTLTDRGDMGLPMLLGRNTIKGKFLVHPGRSFLISRKKKPK